MADAAPVTVSPEQFLAMGRDRLAKQPFSRLLGAERTALAPGEVTIALGGEEARAWR